MSTILIQIVERESAYLVRLKEETGETTESLLPRDFLVRSSWSPDAISAHVGNVGSHERDHLDFHSIADTLYGWLLPSGPVRDRWKVHEAALPRLQLDIQPKVQRQVLRPVRTLTPVNRFLETNSRRRCWRLPLGLPF
jgi:hypothetical protein